MKILKQGKAIAPWWVGKTLTCGTCDHSVQLEAADSALPELKITQQRVHVECPNCHRENLQAINTSDFLQPPGTYVPMTK